MNKIQKKMRRIRYKRYLKSDKWRKIRFLVLKRDGFECVKCGKTHNLQVHHKTYKHIFHEEYHLGDLITLCRVCHKKEHSKKGKRNRK